MAIVAAALLVLAGTGGASPAIETATPAAPAPLRADAQQAKNDPLICQSDKEIGSRIKRRKVCMPKSEWDRQRQENRQLIDRAQVQRGIQPPG